ncbi:hypothetical protein AMOR_38230 [Anaeromyxobacter oryzae]|uniref:Uncharacterized protein n=1 Tax=Anaeromyxobacter oryzae TaxID=2918170 RepID=A0ABN6MV12_9BACT|nr:hypothetical protein AMOR_38230 [Anaeromyxobacter oryzae]
MFKGEWKGWLLITVGWVILGLIASVIAVDVIGMLR